MASDPVLNAQQLLRIVLRDDARVVLHHETPGIITIERVRVLDREGIAGDVDLPRPSIILRGGVGQIVLVLPERLLEPVEAAVLVQGHGWVQIPVK